MNKHQYYNGITSDKATGYQSIEVTYVIYTPHLAIAIEASSTVYPIFVKNNTVFPVSNKGSVFSCQEKPVKNAQLYYSQNPEGFPIEIHRCYVLHMLKGRKTATSQKMKR